MIGRQPNTDVLSFVRDHGLVAVRKSDSESEPAWRGWQNEDRQARQVHERNTVEGRDCLP
jgi:hypothetical protein